MKTKHLTAEIPIQYLEWKKSREVIRGLFEADGSLYFSQSKKGPFPDYPRIEIKSASEQLLNQVNNTLQEREFDTSIRASKTDSTSRILLSGKRMLSKWKKEIGFSDQKTISKYEMWNHLGFYIPRTSHPDRKVIIEALKQIHL
ncbi:LAGLIDADG family homing endonuclease [Candidatus Woesearchaeota archaeon]|nr:LAGLIDADG family homing endonuclease [Candidatus Woesearchaeota archaeon]